MYFRGEYALDEQVPTSSYIAQCSTPAAHSLVNSPLYFLSWLRSFTDVCVLVCRVPFQGLFRLHVLTLCPCPWTLDYIVCSTFGFYFPVGTAFPASPSMQSLCLCVFQFPVCVWNRLWPPLSALVYLCPFHYLSRQILSANNSRVCQLNM